MPYFLHLSEEDVETIHFVGGRYCWSQALLHLNVGENRIEENEAWEIVEAFEADTEGGLDYFPMLDYKSYLAAKLFNFKDTVI